MTTKWSAEEIEKNKATHTWDSGVRFAGSIADGPPPGRNHRNAMVYECLKCHCQSTDELTPEQDATISDEALAKRGELRSYKKKSINVSLAWDGGPCLQESELDGLIEKARALGPMTDEQRREQAASFSFGQLALTAEWRDKPASELAKLRQMCRKAAGCK